MKEKAVFFDKDGTLVRDVPFNVRPELVELAAGAGAALGALRRAGFRLFVVSNQSGVGRGLFRAAALAGVRRRIEELSAAPLDGFYYCPHLPADACSCRKPQSGMLRRAAAENAIDLARSWLVGDILDDVEAGRRAGCRTILLEPGGETEWNLTDLRVPHFMVRSLPEAAAVIITNE